jgi:tRNAThr (cytosine32-N3)-methyltransferase
MEEEVDEFTVFDEYEWTDEMTTAAEEKLRADAAFSMSQFDSSRLLCSIPKYWDKFYRHNRDNFFKERHYLHRDFPEFNHLAANKSSFHLLEFGCGTGASIYPLIETFPTMIATGFDLSITAINLVKSNELYATSGRVRAFVHDAGSNDLNRKIEEAWDQKTQIQIDVVLMIFMLSAMPKSSHSSILKHAFDALALGGQVLFRDYGRYDAAEIRFKPNRRLKLPNKDETHLFARSDGTLAYFFSVEELISLAGSIGFQIVKCDYLYRKFQNRATKKELYRVFLQGVFIKPS